MSYKETKERRLGLVTVELTCDARKGKEVCGNSASITMQDRATVLQFLYDMGWRMMRSHHVCGWCLASDRKITFRRTAKP